jgi:AcrR family transcriptional regulator
VVIREDTPVQRRTPLSRERVLLVAIELADRGGVEALSMRKLGQELGVDAMAPYRHVRNKDDLLDGLVEAILGQIVQPARSDDWKATVRSQAMNARSVMLRHPWARRVLEDRGTAGSAAMAHIEFVLAALRDGGFSLDVAHHALHVLGSRIFGFAQDLFEEGPEPSPEAAAAAAQAAMLLAGRFPRIAEMAGAVSHEGVLGRCDDDVEFAFGLDLVLDGLERMRGT